MKTFWELRKELNEAESHIINELSKDTLKNYHKKSQDHMTTALKTNNPEMKKKFGKRLSGSGRAYQRLKKMDNESVNEISQKTLDTYMDKAAKSRKKSRDYFDKSTSHSQNPKVVAKHKANIDKRTKGMGSVFKRDAVKKRPEYIHKPTYGDNMEKGKKGYTMVNKPASKLPKSYKDR